MANRACLGALLVAALLVGAPACVIIDDDEEPGQVALTWELVEAGTGAEVACAPGDAVRTTFGPFVDIFDCADYEGITSPIEAGSYLGVFQLLDVDGFVLSETSFGVTVFEDAVTDAGHIVFTVD